eukprot:1138209-Pelagomonas_calceolata.AAC.3
MMQPSSGWNGEDAFFMVLFSFGETLASLLCREPFLNACGLLAGIDFSYSFLFSIAAADKDKHRHAGAGLEGTHEPKDGLMGMPKPSSGWAVAMQQALQSCLGAVTSPHKGTLGFKKTPKAM